MKDLLAVSERRFINGADLEVFDADGRLIVSRAATKADYAQGAAFLGAAVAVLCFVLFRYAKVPDFSAWVVGKRESSEMLGLLLIVALTVVGAGLCRCLFLAIRGPDTFVFDRAADRIERNGKMLGKCSDVRLVLLKFGMDAGWVDRSKRERVCSPVFGVYLAFADDREVSVGGGLKTPLDGSGQLALMLADYLRTEMVQQKVQKWV